MKRSLMRGLSLLPLAALSLSATHTAMAQTFPDWDVPCGTALGVGDAGEKYKLMRATVFLAPAGSLTASDIPGYYKFSPHPSGFSSVAGSPVVSSSQFYGEQRMSTGGRGGYLVAPDIITTASHGYFDPDSFAVVFDLRAQDSGSGCTLPDLDHIPAGNIAFPPHDGIIADFPDSIPASITDYRVDYAAFRLKTARTDRSFLRMRRNGRPEADDSYIHASFPERMAMKFYRNVGYLGDMTVAPQVTGQPPQIIPRFTNYALMDGSSGGPLYNLTKGYVETSVGTTGLGCMSLVADTTPGLWQMQKVCPETVGSPLHYNMLNSGSIEYFASEVPADELLVSPLGTVTQVIPLGGTPATTSFSYTLAADAGASASVNYSANVVAPAVGQPTLLTMSSSSGTLSAGTSTTKTATLSAAGISTCGIYEQSLQFNDTSRSFQDKIKHRIEAGLTDYAIDAPASPRFQGIVNPYLPAQIQYTIRNTRPTAIQVKVSNSATWLRIDGVAVPGSGTLDTTYSLAAKGSPGDSAIVTVTLDATNADALSSAEHSANLSFSNISTCANPNASVTRSQTVKLDKRELLLQTIVEDLVPESAVLSPLDSTIDVAESFCLTDIEVKATFLDAGIFGNTAFSTWGPEADLYLVNPKGLSLKIWDHAYWSGSWPFDTGVYDGMAAKSIRLNRSDRLPPSGVSLDTFVSRPAAGTWKLSTADQTVNGKVGLEGAWSLRLKGTPGVCPP
ncbi:hypothetical protein ACFJIW_21960 [Tahibacter sp. UC22_41]|uniref:hypothetical protein n=1 Tax=Tahibacter sp. UC22_41 TaxID=3350178 RepID=UPI0036DADFA1